MPPQGSGLVQLHAHSVSNKEAQIEVLKLAERSNFRAIKGMHIAGPVDSGYIVTKDIPRVFVA